MKYLVSLKLLRVTYSGERNWEVLPRLSKALRKLHLESSRHMTDAAFHSILQENPLKQLEEFLVTGTGNRLSCKTVIRLTSSCPKLKWVGDLRDWNISQRDRIHVLPKLLYQNGWDPAQCEPKDFPTFLDESLHYKLSVSDSFDILTKAM